MLRARKATCYKPLRRDLSGGKPEGRGGGQEAQMSKGTDNRVCKHQEALALATAAAETQAGRENKVCSRQAHLKTGRQKHYTTLSVKP